MPQELEIEIDGKTEKKTVYFEDEVKPLQEESAKHKETVAKLQTEFGVEAGQPLETIFEKAKELKEAANPNWQETRQVIKSLKNALKDKGVEVDDAGVVKSNKQGLSQEEIDKIVEAKVGSAVTQATTNLKKGQLLEGYTPEDRQKIEPVLDKLMTLGGTIEENFELAEAKIFPGRSVSGTKRAYNNANGGGVNVQGDKKEDFSTTPEAKSLGNAMGLSSFKEKK